MSYFRLYSLALILILLVGTPTFAETYYVRADGSGAMTDAAASSTGSCSAAGYAVDLAALNAASCGTSAGEIEAGDTIVLCDDGGEYHGADMPNAGLKVQCSGTLGSPITYTVSGDVVMTQHDHMEGWTLQTGYIWKSNQSLGTDPLNFFYIASGNTYADAKSVGVRVETAAELDALGEWLYDEDGGEYGTADRYYYYSSGDQTTDNPVNKYAYAGTTRKDRELIIDLDDNDYITIDGVDDASNSLLLTMAYHSCVRYDDPDDSTSGIKGIVVKNVIVEYAQAAGAHIGQAAGFVVMRNIEARYNGRHGLYASASTDGVTVIAENDIHDNNQFHDKEWDSDLEFTSGIKLWGATFASSGVMANAIVENNYVYDNGPPISGETGDEGVGIWLDLTHGKDHDNANIVRFNWVDNNTGTGVYLEKVHYTHVYGNVIINHTRASDQNGLFLDAKVTGKDTTNNRIYNNTLWGNDVGIRCVGDNTNTAQMDDNTFANNISAGNLNRELWVSHGCNNILHLVDAQDETSYDNSPTTEGTFVGGASHVATDVITMDCACDVTVDAVDTGEVTEFTVDNSSCTGIVSGNTIAQSSTTGSGTGFTMTPDTDNGVHTYGSGNRFTKNNLGLCSGTPACIAWHDGSSLNNYQTYGVEPYTSGEFMYDANTGESDTFANDFIDSDPSFTATGSDQFWLQSGSTCRNACTDLGDLYDAALTSAASWPDAVTTEYQSDNGSAWECGAYVYEE